MSNQHATAAFLGGFLMSGAPVGGLFMWFNGTKGQVER
jgi:hypothetical protein